MHRLQLLLTGLLITFPVVGSLVVVSDQEISRVVAQNCEELSCSKDSQSEDEYLSCIKEKQSCWQKKIDDARATATSLQSTITLLNGQIALQELQIDQTQTEISILEHEVTDLSARIAGLEVSLDHLSALLVNRIQSHYKKGRALPAELGVLSLDSSSVGQIVAQREYVQRTQTHLSLAMQQAESQRLTYDEQKKLKEDTQAEVEKKKVLLVQQQATLATQKKDQERLLADTKSSEARYQAELAKTMAELNAIQSIIAGRGDETKVGDIKEGETIASVIPGASACSTGTHLHFEVVKDGAHRDPAGYLKSISADWNNSPDSSFAFGGSWQWPIDNPAKINQGYGMTYYARVRRAYGGAPHTGIDMFSKTPGDYSVKAVKEGTLYRGSIPCGGGTLRYVKVEHADGIETYYLHINY